MIVKYIKYRISKQKKRNVAIINIKYLVKHNIYDSVIFTNLVSALFSHWDDSTIYRFTVITSVDYIIR